MSWTVAVEACNVAGSQASGNWPGSPHHTRPVQQVSMTKRSFSHTSSLIGKFSRRTTGQPSERRER
jgi:hypothetical protein